MWEGKFGDEYTDRNNVSTDEVYMKNYGITRSKLNEIFLGDLSRDIRILEVGCNTGKQISLLEEMGFSNLYGIDVNKYALSKVRGKAISTLGSASHIPCDLGLFHLVFTSGLLIHINPKDIKKVMSEIYRASTNYILGMEYWSPKYKKVKYRGQKDMLWKADFAKMYLDNFNLRLIRRVWLPYLDNDNVDCMFLLEKI